MEHKGEDVKPSHRPTEGEIIFVGTGTSEGIPIASCLTKGFERDHEAKGPGGVGEPQEERCRVCFDAVRTDARSPNRRRNTCIMIRWQRSVAEMQDKTSDTNGSDGTTARVKRTHTNVLVDCGKFFWESALEWFPHHRVRYIDALLLTHRHVDACYGLDDLRDWSRIGAAEGDPTPLCVYLREQDLRYLAKPFDYLVDTSLVTPGGGVAQLKWDTIEPYRPFNIDGLNITPLDLEHGNTPMFGFLFGEVAYLSDVNAIPERTRDLIKGCGLLIIDMLRIKEKHPSHFILEETLAEIRLIKPKRALLVGMNHTVDHESTNSKLKEMLTSEGIDVQLAYDGQRLPIRLG